MSVDLLRQQQRWRDALVDIRQMMATLVQEVISCVHNAHEFMFLVMHLISMLHILFYKGSQVL